MKIGLLFPGQGAQHVGMGQKLIAQYPAAKALFDKASEMLEYDLAALCADGPAEKLDHTSISQPALFVTSLAALEVLKATQPDVLDKVSHAAGLSLGEYTALVFAGAMSFEDGLRVVTKRGQVMQAAADANPSGMVSALMLSAEQVENVCQGAQSAGKLWIANYLCPGNTVLSGDKAACAKAVELIEAEGGKAIPLAVAGAFHTPLMQSACEPLDEVLQMVSIQPPRVPVVSNVDSSEPMNPAEIRSLLVKQVVEPVRWEAGVRKMLEEGVDEFYEVGPGRVLKGLLKRVDRKIPCTTINDSPA